VDEDLNEEQQLASAVRVSRGPPPRPPTASSGSGRCTRSGAASPSSWGDPTAVAWSADESGTGAETATTYLNARQASIAVGTNGVQRNGISERVLGLPREPSFDTTTHFSEVASAARRGDHEIG